MTDSLACGISGDPASAADDRWEMAKLAAVTTAAIADPNEALRIFDSMRGELLRKRNGAPIGDEPLSIESVQSLAAVLPKWRPIWQLASNPAWRA